MADEEIQILISAQDEMSATLKRIEGNLDDFGKATKKQTQLTTDAFKSQITTLVSLGNIASSVDNIFSSYTNLQLRLENATERVTGAQERLRVAQERLTDAQKESQRTALSLEKLSVQEERSKKRLQELNNHLAFLIRNKVNPASEKYKNTLAEIQDEEFNLRDIQLTRTELVEKQSKKVVDAQREVESATRGVTIAENNLARANNQVIGTYINMATQSLSVVASSATLISTLSGPAGLTAAFGGLGGAVGLGGLAATAGVTGGLVGLLFVMSKLTTEDHPAFIDALDEQIAKLKELKQNAIDPVTQKFAELIEQEKQIARIHAKYGVKGTISTPPPAAPSSSFPIIPPNIPITTPGVNDAVIKPDGQIIRTHPDDWLFATKNPQSMMGGGMTIIISGDNYGTDPNQIAEALFKKLRRKIAV